MKTRYIYTVLLMALVGWAVLKIPRLLSADSTQTIAAVQKTDPRFRGTEAEIDAARQTKNITALLGINKFLKSVDSPESLYWQAYSLFQLAVLHSNVQDKEKAKQYIDQGIQVLDKSPAKDSEDYALIALMKAFSIRFLSFFNVSAVAQQAKNDGLKAMETDSTNLRAFLVAGLNDFYTPVMFGGQKEAEGLLLRAVKIGDQTGESQGNIHWGYDQALDYLQKFYEQHGKLAQAEAVRKRATVLFPDNAQFKPHPIAPAHSTPKLQ